MIQNDIKRIIPVFVKKSVSFMWLQTYVEKGGNVRSFFLSTDRCSREGESYNCLYCLFIFRKHQMSLKQSVYHHYLQMIEERIASIQKVLTDLKDSAGNETKSTAGDKHEVGLAMLQIEQANTGNQLQDALIKKNALEKINPEIRTTLVVNGSLLKTNRGYLFLSTALGKAEVEGQKIIALSPQSPLGQKLMGLKNGEMAEINGTQYIIESIC